MTERAMQDIEQIVAALNERLESTALGDFYRIRQGLKGGYRWRGGLFQITGDLEGPLSGYAYHKGGRSELQFNIGFEAGHYFRFGVAFSLEPNRNLKDPVSTLRPKIDAFNAALGAVDLPPDTQMWWYQDRRRSANQPAGKIGDALVQQGTFIFFGQRVEVPGDGVSAALIGRAASFLESLLPLYTVVERGTGAEAATPGKVGTQRVQDKPIYIARLAFNSQKWQRPAAAGEVNESGSSYRTENGFGHEDWLFRNEWMVDGWRYGFVQGVNSSRRKLLRNDRAFDLRLFTVPPAGGRRAVAEIVDVECLSDEAATDAVAAFKAHGWLDAMRDEVMAAGGSAAALDKDDFAPFFLNLRYRLDSVRWLDMDAELPEDDPIHRIKRYGLCEVEGAMESAQPKWRGRVGVDSLPDPGQVRRFTKGGWTTFSPEHARMQRKLVEQLREEFPDAQILYENNYVDVEVCTADRIRLFEVKSDLSPLSVIRQALGQIIEYAYHPRCMRELPVELTIVGRRALEGHDLAYFDQLRERLSLPLSYRFVQV